MKIERDFSNSSRYEFDGGRCSLGKGFAQIDTSSDAWYFGRWANPETLEIISYCEGDITVCTAETPEEFTTEILAVRDGIEKWGSKFLGIDCGCSDKVINGFKAVNLGHLLH